MIDMPQVQNIQRMSRDGYTVSEIARAQKVSRPTVRKYLGTDDFNEPTPFEKKRSSKLDEYTAIIDSWLEDDKKSWHKQRHTAKRVFDRLQKEHDYAGSYSLVQRYVKQQKRAGQQEGFLDLVWEPATIQVDFGQADFHIRGVLTRMHYLVVTFPYSNVALAQLFKGENAECVCEGLKSVFAYVGGIPRRAVFDNASGVGKKICDAIRLTELFSRFQLHHGFEVALCNLDSGHEKGSVENAVGTLRRNLFVPIPDIHDITIYNKMLLEECMGRARYKHYRKGEQIASLFEEDCYALRALPIKPFDCIRYQDYKTDKYGNITVGDRFRYSSSPSLALKRVTVGFSSDEITIYDSQGTLIATHWRLYGSDAAESIDPSSSLRLLVTRPGGWRNSQIRASLPESLRNFIDAQDKPSIKACLKTLSEVSEQTDYTTAIEAAWNVYQRTGDMSTSDVAVLAARITNGDGIFYEDEVDLQSYDEAFSLMEVSSL